MIPHPPPLPGTQDAALAGLAQAVASLEKRVRDLEAEIKGQGAGIQAVALEARDLSVTKRLTGAVLAILIPAVLGGVVQAVQNSERQHLTETRLTNLGLQAANAERTAADAATAARILAADAQRDREQMTRILDALTGIERRERAR